MEVWRLVGKAHPLPDGEGARLYGGRWNFPKTAIVYTSSTLALAVLEYLAHLDTDLIPDHLLSVSATIPPSLSLRTVLIPSLPPTWREWPAPTELQKIGTEWAQSKATPVLQVPSALIPSECNLLLNPAHPDFSRILWSTPIPFSLDHRLRT